MTDNNTFASPIELDTLAALADTLEQSQATSIVTVGLSSERYEIDVLEIAARVLEHMQSSRDATQSRLTGHVIPIPPVVAGWEMQYDRLAISLGEIDASDAKDLMNQLPLEFFHGGYYHVTLKPDCVCYEARDAIKSLRLIHDYRGNGDGYTLKIKLATYPFSIADISVWKGARLARYVGASPPRQSCLDFFRNADLGIP